MKTLLVLPVVALAGAGVWMFCPCRAPAVAASETGGPAAPAAAAAVCDDCDGCDDSDECEVDVPLSEVPDSIRKAAAGAVPGISFTSAEKETERGVTVFCLSGTVDGKTWEVEVTPDGKVVEVEQEDGDDD